MPPVPVVIPDGARLRQLRLQMGLKPEELALRVAPHRCGQSIRKMERGGKRTGRAFLTQIAAVLEVDVDELIAEDLTSPQEAA